MLAPRLPDHNPTSSTIPADSWPSKRRWVYLWILTKDNTDRTVKRERRQRTRAAEVLFNDARQLGTMVSRTTKDLTDADIARIAGTFHAWRGVEVLCSSLSTALTPDECRRLDFWNSPG